MCVHCTVLYGTTYKLPFFLHTNGVFKKKCLSLSLCNSRRYRIPTNATTTTCCGLAAHNNKRSSSSNINNTQSLFGCLHKMRRNKSEEDIRDTSCFKKETERVRGAFKRKGVHVQQRAAALHRHAIDFSTVQSITGTVTLEPDRAFTYVVVVVRYHILYCTAHTEGRMVTAIRSYDALSKMCMKEKDIFITSVFQGMTRLSFLQYCQMLFMQVIRKRLLFCLPF